MKIKQVLLVMIYVTLFSFFGCGNREENNAQNAAISFKTPLPLGKIANMSVTVTLGEHSCDVVINPDDTATVNCTNIPEGIQMLNVIYYNNDLILAEITNFPITVKSGETVYISKQEMEAVMLRMPFFAITNFTVVPNNGINAVPVSIATGDFNGDGKPDLVTANEGLEQDIHGTVSILLGEAGAGMFGTSTSFDVAKSPESVVVGDFNGDGRPDIATATQKNSMVSILLRANTQSVSFEAVKNFSVGETPMSIAIGDINGDNKPDLVTGNYDSGNISVLMGKEGERVFESAQNFGVGEHPAAVVIVDINGDGKLDIITANAEKNAISILLGTGNMTPLFEETKTFPVGIDPQSIAMGDFNGDSKLDLATANFSGSNVSILLGTGISTQLFEKKADFQVDGKTNAIAVGDFNRDGKPDLATANKGNNTVSILLGTKTGLFRKAITYKIDGKGPGAIVISDFNGDNKPDLAVTNGDSGNISVLMNTTLLP